MELEQLVEQHEDKLKQHDKELSRLNDMSLEIQKQMNDGLTRVDESNRFLREQNTRQSEQNDQILQAVIKGNESSERAHQFQLKLLDKTNFWKLTIGIGGSAAAIFAALTEIIKVIFK
jgi:homoserine kinase